MVGIKMQSKEERILHQLKAHLYEQLELFGAGIQHDIYSAVLYNLEKIEDHCNDPIEKLSEEIITQKVVAYRNGSEKIKHIRSVAIGNDKHIIVQMSADYLLKILSSCVYPLNSEEVAEATNFYYKLRASKERVERCITNGNISRC